VGFWYRNRAASNFNFVLAGDVVDRPVITNVIVPNLQLISYPFSKPIRMTDMTLTNGMIGITSADADNIIIYKNQAYATYWLSSQAPNERRWVGAGNNLATNVFIQPGEGFWYRSRSASTNLWVEVRPYTF
jgi:hypothetical protein